MSVCEHHQAPEASASPGPRHRSADAARALRVGHWVIWKGIASGLIEAEREGRFWIVTEDLGSVARKVGAPPPLKAA